MPLDEAEAWERMRRAILRHQAEPTPETYAEMTRRSREFRAVFCDDGADDEGTQAA